MITKLTVVRVVGESSVDNIGLVGGELGDVTLDLGVNWDLRQHLRTISGLLLKLGKAYRKLEWGSEMPLHFA